MIDILNQKPLLGRQINWAHPLAKGLVRCFMMNENTGNQIFDLAGYKEGTFSGDVSWDMENISFGASEDRITFDFLSQINLTRGAIELRFIPGWAYTDGNSHYFWDTFGGNNDRFLLFKSTDNDTKLFTNTLSRGSVTISWVQGIEYHLVLNWPDNDIYLRSINGYSLYDFTAGDLDTGSDTFYLGDRYVNANESIDSKIKLLRIWDRNITFDESAQLYREPNAIFQQDRARWFSIPAAVGANPWYQYAQEQ